MLAPLTPQPHPGCRSLQLAEGWAWSEFAHVAEFGRRLGTLVKQRYMLSAMCGRSTYKLTWEEIVALYRLTLDQPAHLSVMAAKYWTEKQREIDGTVAARY
jgi:hypothetical protein